MRVLFLVSVVACSDPASHLIRPAPEDAMRLEVGALTEVPTVDVEITGAPANAPVELFAGSVPGLGTCIPSGPCLDIAPFSTGYVTLASGTTDSQGDISWTLPVPVPPDDDVWLQAWAQAPVPELSQPVLVRRCIDDTYENDDTWATAVPVGSGIDQSRVACPGSPDLVHAVVPPGHVLWARATFNGVREGDVLLQARQPMGSPVFTQHQIDQRATYTPPRSGEAEYWENTSGSVVEVVVEAVLGKDRGDEAGATYRLEVHVDAPEEPPADAPPLIYVSPGDTVTHHAVYSHHDVYAIDVPADRVLVVSGTSPRGISMVLQDAQRQQVDFDDIAPYEVSAVSSEPSTFYVQVNKTGPYTRTHIAEYTLSFETLPMGCVDDDTDADELISNAPALRPGGSFGGVACATEWRRLALRAGETLKATIEPDEEDQGRIRGLLVSAAGQLLGETTFDDRPQEIFYTATADEFVFLGAEPALTAPGGLSVGYRVRASLVEPCVDDGLGGGQVSLWVGLLRHASLCSEDQYRGPSSSSDAVSVRVVPSEPIADMKVAIRTSYSRRWWILNSPPYELDLPRSAGLEFISVTSESYGEQLSYTIQLDQPPIASCVEDAFHPNHSLGDAWHIASGDRIEGALCPGSVGLTDFYQIDLSIDDTLRFNLDANERWHDVFPEIIAPNGTRRRFGDFVPNGSYTARDAGTHYIHLAHGSYLYNGGIDYALTVHVDPLECNDDLWEPNDDLTEAASTAQLPIEATLCAASPDLYRLDAQAGSDIDLVFDNATFDATIEILDSAGNIVPSSAREDHDAWVQTFRAPATGTYHLRLSTDVHAGPQGYAYVLRDILEHRPGTCWLDRHEPDEEPALGTVFTDRSFKRGMVCGADEDWTEYRFPLGSIPILTLEADPSVRLRLFDNELRLVDQLSGSKGLSPFEQLDDGAFYAEVVQLDPAANSEYVLTVDGCIEDPVEPDDTPATASPLEIGSTAHTLCGWSHEVGPNSRHDMYTIDLVAGQELTVVLNYDVAAGTMVLDVPGAVYIDRDDAEQAVLMATQDTQVVVDVWVSDRAPSPTSTGMDYRLWTVVGP